MTEQQSTELDSLDGRTNNDLDEIQEEPMLTTAADVESAGRSCMAILVLGVIIVLLLCVWIGFRQFVASQ